MIVCKYCLEAIESREGSVRKRKLNADDGPLKDGYGDATGEYVYCEWCKEYAPIDEAYKI